MKLHNLHTPHTPETVLYSLLPLPETAAKFGVSYQQARSYTVKYEAGGVDALNDRRGRAKSIEEMSELEKLQAENRILRAEKRQAEMEVSFLKKLDAIERRRG